MSSTTLSFNPLPADRLARLEGWAMLAHSMGYLYRPSTIEAVCDVLRVAQSSGRSLVPRGSGFSYGDTALNAENIVLELGRLNRILDWEPHSGIIRVEPGVTIGQLWRHVLEDGWWPAVVPGTMFPTVAGCASTNVHGKNHWRVGSFGWHILSFDLLLPSGEMLCCRPTENEDIFRAATGGLGLLGIITALTLQLAPVESGLLRVRQRVAPSLSEMFAIFEETLPRAGYLIGWVDAFAGGSALGRGLVQSATILEHDPARRETLRPTFQDLPDTLFGILPRSLLWRGMTLVTNDQGMRALNIARFTAGMARAGQETLVPQAQFHFMLDYVPNWKWAFRPGIIQYQPFIPTGAAPAVFTALLEASQQARLIPNLAVFKRHQPDPFLLSYSVDGYSLALDYHATPATEPRIRELLSRFTTDVVLPAGGRFYPAKDTTLDRAGFRTSFGPEAVDTFLALKRRLDPGEMLQSDLYRRVLR